MKKITSEARERIHFDKFARQYDEIYRYNDLFAQYKINKKVDDFVKFVTCNCPEKDLVILEIGCGTGEYTQKIAARLPKARLIGLDISRSIVDVAKTKCEGLRNISFVVESAYNAGLEDNSVDVVFGFYSLHHLDVLRVNREMSRILKPHGLVFFCEPNILNPAVFLTRSNQFLKRKFGVSPDEWAVNPITVVRSFAGFRKIELYIFEFVWPLKIIPLRYLMLLDRITSFLRFIPLLDFLGGSVVICLQKR